MDYHGRPLSHRMVAIPIRTSGECLRFANAEEGRVAVWEAAFTFIHPPPSSKSRLYLSQAISTMKVPCFILLPQDSPSSSNTRFWSGMWRLPSFFWSRSHQISFSSDGHVFACIASCPPEAHVWRESPTGLHAQSKAYIPRRKSELSWAFLSPNRESIVAQAGGDVTLPLLSFLIHTLSQPPSLLSSRRRKFRS